MEQYAGIDVSLDSASVCIVDAQGKILKEAKVACEPQALIAWLGAHGTPMARIGRWCKIATLGLGSAAVGRIGPSPRSPDDRCPTRPMNRAGTRSPRRATRSATGRR